MIVIKAVDLENTRSADISIEQDYHQTIVCVRIFLHVRFRDRMQQCENYFADRSADISRKSAENIDEQCLAIKNVYLSGASQVVGDVLKRYHKIWLTTGTWKRVDKGNCRGKSREVLCNGRHQKRDFTIAMFRRQWRIHESCINSSLASTRDPAALTIWIHFGLIWNSVWSSDLPFTWSLLIREGFRKYAWSTLCRMDIPKKLDATIRATYDCAKCRLLHRSKISEMANVESGSVMFSMLPSPDAPVWLVSSNTLHTLITSNCFLTRPWSGWG